jgi:hypothetical protein
MLWALDVIGSIAIVAIGVAVIVCLILATLDRLSGHP